MTSHVSLDWWQLLALIALPAFYGYWRGWNAAMQERVMWRGGQIIHGENDDG